QGSQNLASVSGKVAHHAQMIAKADQKSAVGWSQHLLQERVQMIVVRFEETFLTAAHVQDQTQRERHLGAAGEEGNLLRRAVLENLKIVLRQIRGQSPTGIAHGESDVDQVDIDADRRHLLRHQRSETEQDHESAHNGNTYDGGGSLQKLTV